MGFPTMANVNHSCDPNFTIVNFFGSQAVAFANRSIEKGEEVHDTYGAVFYHMDKSERQRYLKASHWFSCTCKPCSDNWPHYLRLPKDYLKLSGSHFKYKRCNRKELQRDVDKMKKKIKIQVQEKDDGLAAAKAMYMDWSRVLDELLITSSHKDFVNVRRGLRNCLWLMSPAASNVVRVREDESLREAKSKYKG